MGLLPSFNVSRKIDDTFLLVSTLVALCVYSYAGEILRRLCEVIFGLACHDPNTILSGKDWPVCTTDPGTTSSYGGAVFTDLPANMFGCFVMGLLVRGEASLGIPVDIPIAIVPRQNFFQRWTATHVALRSGLCGSLTTFASWNTQMVTMICDGKGTVLHSQWVSALFGYALGWMAAVESYRAGRDLAVGIHRRTNPDLQREADTGKGLVINRDLPDEERRYLHDLLEHDSQGDLSQLQRWKETSHDDRNGRKQEELFAIERAILVDNETPGKSLMELADDAGWDVTALKNWKNAQVSEKEASDANELCNANELSLNLLLYLVATGLLVWGAISVTGSVRTYCIATLLAPFGTILRWRLSRLNGSITNPRWEWFPIGTYTANMLASALSCLLAALSVGMESQLALTFLNAILSGFAGSLSTVSTFVVEIVELLRSLPQHARGYHYLVGSLVSSLILGVICYLWAVV